MLLNIFFILHLLMGVIQKPYCQNSIVIAVNIPKKAHGFYQESGF